MKLVTVKEGKINIYHNVINIVNRVVTMDKRNGQKGEIVKVQLLDGEVVKDVY